MSFPARRVAVVGAGISGVNTAAHLLAEGLDVTVFERSPVVGGVWILNPERPLEPTYPSAKASVADTTFHSVPKDVDPHILHAPPGPCYDGLQNNVATPLLEVSLNKWKPDVPPYTTHDRLADYIQDTAAKTGVADKIVFDTKVDHIEKIEADNTWRMTTSTWNYKAKSSTSKDWTFDAVVIASGHYHAPLVPNIPGLSEWKAAFPSRVQHSKGYRNAKGFENKTVLIIGGAASATDIAVELAATAKKIYQSTRNGPFDLSVDFLPDNAERVAEVRTFGRLTDGPLSDTQPIPAAVTLIDGRLLDGIDLVILATGYQFSLPFLRQLHNDAVAPEDADGSVLVTDGHQIHNLHRDIFYIPDPTLAFVGVPFYTATFSFFEFQAIAVAAVFSGKTKLPPVEQQHAEYQKRVQETGYGKKFHSLRLTDSEYVKSLMAWVNDGRAPQDRKTDGYSAEWVALRTKTMAVPNRKKKVIVA